jgi:hypothetical protein
VRAVGTKPKDYPMSRSRRSQTFLSGMLGSPDQPAPGLPHRIHIGRVIDKARDGLEPNLLEHLACLQRSASAVAHIDEPVKDAQHRRRQRGRQRHRFLGKGMDEGRDSGRDRRSPPTERDAILQAKRGADLVNKRFGRIIGCVFRSIVITDSGGR